MIPNFLYHQGGKGLHNSLKHSCLSWFYERENKWSLCFLFLIRTLAVKSTVTWFPGKHQWKNCMRGVI